MRTTAVTLALCATLALPGLAVAQNASGTAKPAAKSAAKAPAAAPKASAKTAAASSQRSKRRAEATSSRTQLRSATGQVAAGLMAAEAALSPEEMALADLVHVGRIPCELGAFVNVEARAGSPGYFNVSGKGFNYLMAPVPTSTGALRLEDKRAGAVWIQIANKSMLMNQKAGQRLADECMSPAQLQVAESIKLAPPQSLLDSPNK